MTRKIGFAQIGLGRWGPNLLRCFSENEAVDFRLVCDLNPEKVAKVRRFGIPGTADPEAVLARGNGIEAVVIATPLATHEVLARRALAAGKQVFIEKPLAASTAAAAALVELAERSGLVLMVGHVFLFNDGIRYVKQLLATGAIGRPLLIHGQRTNLGPIRDDANALWDLASHDLAIFNYWLDAVPEAVCCVGHRPLGGRQEDVVDATFYYPGGVPSQILVSWIHPRKVRLITVVGERLMVEWDDMSPAESVKIYDKGVNREEVEQAAGTWHEFRFSIHEGAMSVPRFPVASPLQAECDHFVECLLSERRPLSDGRAGLAVVRVLEAAGLSLARGGARVPV